MVGTYDPSTSTAETQSYTYSDNGVRYVTSSADGFRTYTQSLVTATDLLAFNTYFIQAAATGDLTFTLSQRAQEAPSRSRMTDAPEEVAFGIVLSSTESVDHTGMLYGERFTDDYNMGADLVKMHGSTPAFALYSLAASDERAFNALALNAAAAKPN